MVSLEDVCVPGGLVRGPFGGSLKKNDFVASGYQVYEQRHAIAGTWSGARYFVDAGKCGAMKRFAVVPGDFIVSCSGTIGRIYQVPERAPRGIINQALLKISVNSHVIDPKFFYFYFQWETFQSLILDSTQGGAMQNLVGMAIFRKSPINLPPMGEQQAIARALRIADESITVLERIVAKKQAINQGMMQQLLTGKTRLPGFSGPWVEGRLGDVLNVRHGRSQGEVECRIGKYPILATGGQIGWADAPLYSKPSVLIGRKGTIDRPQYQATPFWTVDTLFYTEISEAADPRYLYYLFLTIDWRSMNEASGVPSLSSRRVEGVDIRIPHVGEQRAIREVLDDVNLEIESLERRLAKAEAVKQGMTQQLLTGRTRLPITAGAE